MYEDCIDETKLVRIDLLYTGRIREVFYNLDDEDSRIGYIVVPQVPVSNFLDITHFELSEIDL